MGDELDSAAETPLNASYQSALDALDSGPSGSGRLFIRDGFASPGSASGFNNRQIMWNGSAFVFVGQVPVNLGANIEKKGLALYNGELVISDNFLTPARYIAHSAIDPVSWSTLGPPVDLSLELIAASGSNLYVTRNSSQPIVTAIPNTRGIALYNGSAWNACAQGISGIVRAMQPYGFGSMTIAGGFRILPDLNTVHNYANFGGTSFSARDIPTTAAILCIGSLGGAIPYAGTDSISGNNLWRDRGGWEQIPNTGGAIRAIYYDPITGFLFVGGDFGIRAVNGTTVSQVGGGVTGGNVTSITAFNGEIVVSGTFTHAGGVLCKSPTSIYGNEPGAAGGYAVWNRSSWRALNPSGFNNNPRPALQMLEA